VVTGEPPTHFATRASLIFSAISILSKPCNPASGNKDGQDVLLCIFKSVNGQADETQEGYFSKFLLEAGTVQFDVIHAVDIFSGFFNDAFSIETT
jgi:hypothetical protein